MGQVILSISDKFYEIGNRLFNVSDLEYSESYDLGYESTDDTSFNKAFINFENKSKDINSVILKFIFSIYEFLFSKKEQLAVIGGAERTESTYMAIIKLNKPNCANSVIRNNVRNRLLQSINEGVNKTDIIKKTVPKQKPKLKNQFVNDIASPDVSPIANSNRNYLKMITKLKKIIENRSKLLNNFQQINFRA